MEARSLALAVRKIMLISPETTTHGVLDELARVRKVIGVTELVAVQSHCSFLLSFSITLCAVPVQPPESCELYFSGTRRTVGTSAPTEQKTGRAPHLSAG